MLQHLLFSAHLLDQGVQVEAPPILLHILALLRRPDDGESKQWLGKWVDCKHMYVRAADDLQFAQFCRRGALLTSVASEQNCIVQ